MMSKQVIYSYSTLKFESGEHTRFDLTISKIVIRSTQSSKKYDQFLAEYADSKISPIYVTVCFLIMLLYIIAGSKLV